MKRKALGKGLKAFIPEEYGILKEERYADLETEQIKPNPLQPRLKFDKESIDELARSIKESGVLQPVIVVPEGNYYRIVVGERRWRAAQKIGLRKIPSLIRSMPKAQQLEISLVENLQREDLNPLEIASFKNIFLSGMSKKWFTNSSRLYPDKKGKCLTLTLRLFKKNSSSFWQRKFQSREARKKGISKSIISRLTI